MDTKLKFIILGSLLVFASCRSIDNDKDSKEKKDDEKTNSKEDDKGDSEPKSDSVVSIRSDGLNGYLNQGASLGGNEVLHAMPSDQHLASEYPTSSTGLDKLLGNGGVGIGELPGSHQPNLGHGGINEGLKPVPPPGNQGVNHNVNPFHNGLGPLGVFGNGGLNGLTNPGLGGLGGLTNPGIGGLGNGIFGGIGGLGLNGGQLGLLFGNVLLQAIANFIQNAQPIIANMAG